MTDSWTDDEAEDKPRLRELLQEGPPEAVIGVPVAPEVQRDIERREKLRADEVQHLTELRERVQRGIDDGAIDLESGTALLLNISKVRMALAGVGYYPGAW